MSGTAGPGVALGAAQRSPPLTLPPKSRTAPTSNDGAGERSGPLTIELERIDGARAALASGAAERALTELSEYERIRSTGTLDREAWILRIDALLALGKRGEARELARGYLERFPKDAHATRLRELANGT